MNPMQLIAMLRGGGNPQQLVMSLLQGEMGNTPMGQNLLSLAQKGDSSQILADLIATYGQEIVGITNCLNNRIRGTS